MRFSDGNFLFNIKNIVTGLNGDDTPVAGTTLPGNSGSVLSSTQSADGGIKVDENIPLGSVTNSGGTTTLVDSSGGTASNTLAAETLPSALTNSSGGTPSTTIAAITNTNTPGSADVVPTANAIASLTTQMNTATAQLTALRNAVASLARAVNSNQGSVSSVATIVVPAAGATIGTVSFPITRDYDEASDHLAIRIMAALAAGDTLTTGTITGTLTVLPIATGVPVTKTLVVATAPFGTAPLILSTREQVFNLNFSGYGLKRDDVVSIALAITGTSSVGVDVYAIEKHFDSCIVSYNDTTGDDNPSTASVAAGFNQPGFGFPLR